LTPPWTPVARLPATSLPLLCPGADIRYQISLQSMLLSSVISDRIAIPLKASFATTSPVSPVTSLSFVSAQIPATRFSRQLLLSSVYLDLYHYFFNRLNKSVDDSE
jgi:hypothetical protein